MRNFKFISTFCALLMAAVVATAAERTILLGPKTIGAGWKDNIVIQPQQFATTQVGDILTVYVDEVKGGAQGAFQDPADWQAIAPEYAYFGVSGPFRLKVTQEILDRIKQRGLAIGGHDYRILRVTHLPAAEMVEKVVYRGPSVLMKDDWSASAAVQKDCFKDVKVGDALHFKVSRVEEGAALKVMDFRWNAMEPSLDGVPVGKDGVTVPIVEQSQLIKLQLAGSDGVSMRVGGKGYRLEKISVVSFTGVRDEDLTNAQRAPKEYKLQPGELFHGEKVLPQDWSGNLRITAEPFQECTESDCIVVSYKDIQQGCEPQISFRENKGKWLDLTGSQEPVWYKLDGNDVVLTLDAAMLDKLMTDGLVITGVGATITKVYIIHIN